MGDSAASDFLMVAGALFVAVGAAYQTLLAALDERHEGAELFRAVYSLEREESRSRFEVAGLWPWSFRKRRALRREAKRAVRELLAPDEGYQVRRSDHRGMAWALVCVGSTASAVAAVMDAIAGG